jgi:hypothetical protein
MDRFATLGRHSLDPRLGDNYLDRMQSSNTHLGVFCGGVALLLGAAAYRASLNAWWPLVVALGALGVAFGLAGLAQHSFRWLKPRWTTWRQRVHVGQTARRLPQQPTVYAVGGQGLRLDDGRVKQYSVGSAPPGTPRGTLAVRIQMEGLRGERVDGTTGEEWVWILDDVHFVNATDDVLVFQAWLTVPLVGHALTQIRGDVVRLEPRASTSLGFRFVQALWHLDEATQLSPPGSVDGNLEFVLLEVGTDRDLRIPFMVGVSRE